MSDVILITGGSSGLGAAIADHLSAVGYKVYATSRSQTGDIKKYSMIQMDVSNRNSIKNAFELILEKEGKIDVLINNAGLGMAAPVEEASMTDIEKLFSTNVIGVLNTTQLILPIMRKQKKGLIINITSIAAEIALPYRGLYCASKSAVEKLTDALRMEIKDFGIQACTFQAGDIKTNINSNRLTAKLDNTSAYAIPFNRINQEIHSDVNNAVSPYFYAKKIENILKIKQVTKTYVEGRFLQRFSRFLSRILPGKWFEKIIMSHYRL